MEGATLAELRDIARRSRRTQRTGFLALLGALLMFPLHLVASAWLPTTPLAYGGVAIGGALFVRYAFVAGKERGEYRRIFARLAQERRVTRTIVPSEPQNDISVSVEQRA